jgi:putative ABC transport system permease protein
MNWNDRIRQALAAAGHPPDDDVVEELAQHARALYDERRADGRTAADADRAVEEHISVWCSDASSLKRRSHRAPAIEPPPALSSSWTAGLFQDVRYAVRLLRRQSGFALLAIGTMALGIAATTVLFSVTYGVLMKPLPWPDSDRLLVIKETRGGNRPRFNSFSNAAYLAWREQPATVEGLGAWSTRVVTLTGSGDPERLRVTTASPSLFSVLGVRPIAGSLFGDDDDASNVIVLSESLWRQRFGGDPAAIGRSAQLDGKPYTIVGVLADDHAFPDGESRGWVPFRVLPTTGNYLSMFNAVAKLRPGATPAQAAAEGSARGLNVANTGMTTMAVFGGSGPVEISAAPFRDGLTAEVRRPIVVLLVAVALLFATATANVTSLQLARATTRRREMAIRAALGAGATRVIRQLLVESLLLSSAGGAVGLLLATLIHRALPTLLPAGFPRTGDIDVNAMVVLFALTVSMLAGILSGLIPALRVRRLNLVESLSEDGQAAVGPGNRSGVVLARRAIMIGQVAIACVLLVGASLLGRSFLQLVRADRGFDPSNVLTARVQMPAFAFAAERRMQIVEEVTARLREVPGVKAVTVSDGPPLGIYGGTAFMIDDRQAQASSRTVTPGYFAAMGMRLEGRDFTDEDVATSRPVFIANRTFARQYLGPTPVGQRVRGWVREQRGTWEIIGVVDDVRHRGVTEPPEPEVYRCREKDDRSMSPAPTFIVRTAGEPGSLAPTLRAIVRGQDSALVVDSVMTMEERVLSGLAQPRLYAVLLGGFGGLALLVAGVGLFGVLSYNVAQRSREIALRSALGARPADIAGLVLRQGLGVTAAGSAAGILASSFLMRSLTTFFYGVTPHDPATFVAVPLLLLLVATLACFVPARRAVTLDPLQVLKGG